MKYEIEAKQWFKYGDHSAVGYYRHPNIDGESECPLCHNIMHDHGWIDQENDHMVCPSDYVITATDGSYLVMCTNLFEGIYLHGLGKCDHCDNPAVVKVSGYSVEETDHGDHTINKPGDTSEYRFCQSHSERYKRYKMDKRLQDYNESYKKGTKDGR